MPVLRQQPRHKCASFPEGRRQFSFVCASELRGFSLASAAAKPSVRSGFKPCKAVEVKNIAKLNKEDKENTNTDHHQGRQAGSEWVFILFYAPKTKWSHLCLLLGELSNP